MLDLKKVSNVVVEGIDTKDYPDFCDAFIVSAEMDGVEMTDEEIEELNNHYPDFVYESVINKLF